MDQGRINLLFIDDSPEVQNDFSELLSNIEVSNYDLHLTCSFKHQVSAHLTEPIDLIFLGSTLSLLFQQQLTDSIRKISNATIVCCCAKFDIDHAQIALESGASDYLCLTDLTPERLGIVIMRNTVLNRENNVKATNAASQGSSRPLDYQNLLGRFEDVIFITDSDGSVCYVNPNLSAAVGLNTKNLLGSQFGIPVTGSGNALIDILKQYDSPQMGEMRVREVQQDSQLYYLVTIDDVDRYRNCEDFFIRQKHQLADTLYNLGDGLVNVDMNGKIVLLNHTAEQMMGDTLANLSGVNLNEVFPLSMPEPFKDINDFLNKVGEDNQVISLKRDCVLEKEHLKKLDLQVVGQTLFNDETSQKEVLLIIRDVTHLRMLEAELIRKDKLESIGVLAGGLAHDINNLLTGVLGNVSLARLYIDTHSEAAAALERAEKALSRARGISQQLLTFSKGGRPTKETGQITSSIFESVAFALSGSNSVVNYDFDKDLQNVDFDAAQIGQVIQNLVTNALQAMPLGGRLTIAGHNERIPSDSSLPLNAGEYVHVCVQDTGHGISKDICSKIFDPYFTTKQKGNGLGLATCHSIIAKHEGHIAVESELGVGTIFHVYLPVSTKKATRNIIHKPDVLSGHGKILIVDDEEMVIETSSMLLEKLGYDCSMAMNSRDALRIFKEAKDQQQPFDLIILDLTLPGDIGGEEILQQLREVDDSVLAIVSSGYADNEVLSDHERFGFNGIAVKPYSLTEISTVIAELLKSETVLEMQ